MSKKKKVDKSQKIFAIFALGAMCLSIIASIFAYMI